MLRLRNFSFHVALLLTFTPNFLFTFDMVKKFFSSSKKAIVVAPIEHIKQELPKAPLCIKPRTNFDSIKEWAVPIGIASIASVGAIGALYIYHKFEVKEHLLAQSQQQLQATQNELNMVTHQRNQMQNNLYAIQNQLNSVNENNNAQNQTISQLQKDCNEAQSIVTDLFQDTLKRCPSALISIQKRQPNLLNIAQLKKTKSLLHTAIHENNSNQLKILLKLGHDANLLNNQGRAPLVTAIIHKNLTAIKMLLESGADPNQEDISTELKPLHRAIIQGNINIVKVLLKHGADLNATTPHGETALSLGLIAHPKMLRAIQKRQPNIRKTFKMLCSKDDTRKKNLIKEFFQNNLKSCCPICLEEIKTLITKQSNFSLPSCCMAIFCDTCLVKSQANLDTCPACRQNYEPIHIQSTMLQPIKNTPSNFTSSSSSSSSYKHKVTTPKSPHKTIADNHMSVAYPYPTLEQFQQHCKLGFDGKYYLPCYNSKKYITHSVSLASNPYSFNEYTLWSTPPEAHPNFFFEYLQQYKPRKNEPNEQPLIGMIRHTALWKKRILPTKHIHSHQDACQVIDVFPELSRQYKKTLETFARAAGHLASDPGNVSDQLKYVNSKPPRLTHIKSLIARYHEQVCKMGNKGPTTQLIHAMNLFFDANGTYIGLPQKIEKKLLQPILFLQAKLAKIIFQQGCYRGLLHQSDQHEWRRTIGDFLQKYVYTYNGQYRRNFLLYNAIENGVEEIASQTNETVRPTICSLRNRLELLNKLYKSLSITKK